MRPRQRDDAPDGLQERRRLKLAALPGAPDEAALDAVRPPAHPLYRRGGPPPAQHRERGLGVPPPSSPERPGPGGGAA